MSKMLRLNFDQLDLYFNVIQIQEEHLCNQQLGVHIFKYIM
jgi:hypothetical protein